MGRQGREHEADAIRAVFEGEGCVVHSATPPGGSRFYILRVAVYRNVHHCNARHRPSGESSGEVFLAGFGLAEYVSGTIVAGNNLGVFGKEQRSVVEIFGL